jgi:exopolysaccharide biosynthesis WecB/TagA/CpsF family protein
VLFVGMTAPKQEKWAYKLVESSQLIVDSEEKKKVDSGQFKVERQIVDNLQLIVDSSQLIVESRQTNIHDSELKTQNSKLTITDYQLPTTDYRLSTIHCQLTDNCHVCCIGAVFDFYAGTVKRAPRWMIGAGMEWLYRFEQEPRRLWRRYLIGNVKFTWAVFLEVIGAI